jgi:hypothetical protein
MQKKEYASDPLFDAACAAALVSLFLFDRSRGLHEATGIALGQFSHGA